ncbi:polysaccharide pyruvyl transferase family protein [Clostridium perfringens]|uniref:polysaccharide pyruvyl transferase family protein n=1 Tax=Clostridium perfringens TaxID=1502 RepID=UPI0018E4688A|nr:polysaccharide pyruvyl transferase family protein [Clostridium perfringens]EIF6174298.1 polysaccharide pyruvyl transferase family protein [Clostridium perfringens]MBI6047914.1 polysaccharide pyruvyl transferase family protein [Clostridium perfringens]MDM0806576.1 polysaccharide pyruvyl transferase family protein [Clostridium perfringens]
MDNKIGILTWHYFPNYGSALQAYALQKTIINNISENCKIINYRNYKYSPKGVLKIIKNNKFLYMIICKVFRKERAYKFNQFINNNLNMTKEVNSIKELTSLNNEFKFFICGSDQIWSPNVLDEAYLLSFVKNFNIRISYAPSIVINKISNEQKNIYNENIKKFNSLSVRESKGRDIISEVTGIIPEVVLDPTLLLDKEEYKKVQAEININEKYILCYILGDYKKYEKYINEISKQYNMKIVAILSNKSESHYGDYNIYNAGPAEFLGYIDNAEMILTDSFHGLAFSIIYKKEFLIFERFSHDDILCQNDRIYNLLDKLKINNRIIKDNIQFNLFNKIDYDYIYNNLEKEKEQSIAYIKNSINIGV